MAYRLAMSALSRSAGRSAPAAAAYRACECITNQASGIVHDFTKKKSAVASFIVGFPGTRSDLWNAAEAAETRINSVTAREITLNLPHEASPEKRQEALREFAELLNREYGCAVDVSEHKAGRWDARNLHAHLQITTRFVDPATGQFGKKDRRFNMPDGKLTIEKIRADWSKIVKTIAADPAKWDHRSFERQGVDQVARPRVSNAAIAAMKITELETLKNDILRRKGQVGIRIIRDRITRSAVRRRGANHQNRTQSMDQKIGLQAVRGVMATRPEAQPDAQFDGTSRPRVFGRDLPLASDYADRGTASAGVRGQPSEQPIAGCSSIESEAVEMRRELDRMPEPVRKSIEKERWNPDQIYAFLTLPEDGKNKFVSDVAKDLAKEAARKAQEAVLRKAAAARLARQQAARRGSARH